MKTLKEVFGESVCSESTLGSPTDTMYNCNPPDPDDYKACYVQKFPTKNYVSCTIPQNYTYNGMTGSITCSVSSDGSITSGNSCGFHDAETGEHYTFDNVK